MRRVQVWGTWLLLAAEVAWLGGQPRPVAEPVLASEPAPGLRTRSVQTAEGVAFFLENHPASLIPSVTVAARDRLDEALHYDRSDGRTTVATLPRRQLEQYPAQLLRYTWTVGGTEIPGQHLYINPAYPYEWKVRQAQPFTVYYTGAYPAEQVDRWREVYGWLTDMLLM